MRQAPLFEERLPPGFSYHPDFISEAEEESLLEGISKLDWQLIKMHGVIARRKVVHFGLDYTYDTRQVSPTDPAPRFLKPLIARGARTLGKRPDDIAEILVTHYPPGAGIGWHRDAPAFDLVLGVSLSGICTMKFRHKVGTEFEVVKKDLEPRSAYVLSGRARWEWQHSIPPVKESRYSITLRTLRAAST